MKKKVLLTAFVLVILSLAGCSVGIDKVTTFKGSHIFKSLPSATEVLVIEIVGVHSFGPLFYLNFIRARGILK